MKKLILISSLLAAGTMVSNAATNLELTKESVSGSITWQGTYWSKDDINAQEINLGSIGFDSNTTIALTSLTFALTTISSTTSATNIAIVDSDWNVLGVSTTKTSATQTFGGASSKATVTFSFSATDIESSTILNSSTTYLAVFLSSSDNVSDSNGKLVGTSVTTLSSGKMPLYQNADTVAGVAKILTFGIDGTISSTTKEETGYGAIGAMYAATGLKVNVIPEPSLFGLFAGTLALGLAGTRRRRRAK